MTAEINITQKIAASVTIANQLKRKGYAKFCLSDIMSEGEIEGFAALCRETFPFLTKDPYDLGDNRDRAYTRFLHNSQSGSLEQVDFEDGRTAYLQHDEHKPEKHVAGVKRYFNSLTKDQAKNPALNSAILAGALMCQIAGLLNQTDPNLVGVHFLRMRADTPDKLAVGVPDLIHVDGEIVTIAIMFNRQNVDGGENLIAKRSVAGKHPSEISSEDEIEWFTLENAFDCWIIDDSKISHYVSPIKMLDRCGPRAERDIVLIDFCPYRAVLTEGVK